MKITRILPVLLTLVLSASVARAEKDALKPMIAKAGAVIAEDTFGSAELGKTWAAAKGDWAVNDGALSGKFKESDNHAAVLTLGVPNRNSIIQFSFKLDAAKGFALSFNSAKGHLFRIGVSGDGLAINKDKNKKDPKSKAVALVKAGGKIAPGEWHTMLVEVKDGKVCVQTDTGLKAEAENAELDVDKTGYRFVTAGSLVLDDVKAWQAE